MNPKFILCGKYYNAAGCKRDGEGRNRRYTDLLTKHSWSHLIMITIQGDNTISSVLGGGAWKGEGRGDGVAGGVNFTEYIFIKYAWIKIPFYTDAIFGNWSLTLCAKDLIALVQNIEITVTKLLIHTSRL